MDGNDIQTSLAPRRNTKNYGNFPRGSSYLGIFAEFPILYITLWASRTIHMLDFVKIWYEQYFCIHVLNISIYK